MLKYQPTELLQLLGKYQQVFRSTIYYEFIVPNFVIDTSDIDDDDEDEDIQQVKVRQQFLCYYQGVYHRNITQVFVPLENGLV